MISDRDQYIQTLVESLEIPNRNRLSPTEAIWRGQQILGVTHNDIDKLIHGLQNKTTSHSKSKSMSQCVICSNARREGLLCLGNHFTCNNCLQSWFQFNMERGTINILCPALSEGSGQWCSHTHNEATLLKLIPLPLQKTWQNLSVALACKEEKLLLCSDCNYGVVALPVDLQQTGWLWTCPCETVMCYLCDPPKRLGKEKEYLEHVLEGKHYHHIAPRKLQSIINKIISSVDEQAQCPLCKIYIPLEKSNTHSIIQCLQCYNWICLLCSKALGKKENIALGTFSLYSHHNPEIRCEALWDDKAKMHWKTLRIKEYVEEHGLEEKEVKSVLVGMGLEPASHCCVM